MKNTPSTPSVPSPASPPVVVVENGATRWRIHVPPRAGVVERFAADELKKYIRQITGAALEETSSPSAAPAISVGLRGDLALSDLPAPAQGFDGYAIVVAPDRIVLAGDNPRGALYAAYDLLERAGCRWWHPTLDPNDPEVVPANTHLAFHPGQWTHAAPIELRVYNGSAFFFWIHPPQVLPQIDWAAKNRYNVVSWQPNHEPGSMERDMETFRDGGALDALDRRGLALHGPCHSFPFFLPTERYFADHPEWFGLHDGERRPHGGQWPLVNYCWSNPEANAEFIRNVEDFVRRWPQIRILNLVWIDGGLVCQCPACRERGASNLIVDLFNQLSDRLETRAPGVELEAVVGYGPLEAVPAGAVANGKWMAVYAHWGRNHRASYNDPDYPRRSNFLVWRSYFPRFEACSYYAASSHQPFTGPPFLHAIEGDTRFIVEQNIAGHYVLHYPHRFWWNHSFTLGAAGKHAYYYPNRAPRPELRDYALTYFGPKAGPLIAEYLAMLGANENLDKSYRACNAEATDEDMEWLRAMEQLRLRAAMLADDDPVVSHRLAKLGASQQFLLEWGQSRRLAKDAEAAYQILKAAKHTPSTASTLSTPSTPTNDAAPKPLTEDALRNQIADARARMEELKILAATIEKKFPGTLEAEWIESWYMNRLLKAPLDRIESDLTSSRQPPI